MSSDDIKNENPGLVTSDSLAAESIQSGGGFAADSSYRGPGPQPSAGTTSNTTDVSNATVLQPAPDASTRLEREGYDATADLNAGIGEGKNAGRGPTWNLPDAGNATEYDNPRPKGQGLKEGGFDPDAPNASFSTDIGSRKDPGRVALEQMQTADASAAGGDGPRQSEITGDGQYDALKRDESA